MTDGPFLWFLNRGTGLVLLALLTLVTALGIAAWRARAGGRVPGFVAQSLHRNLSLLAVVLLVAHVTSAVADEYVDIRWWQAFVPWHLAYRPGWLALGTMALDLVAATVVTSLLRDRIGRRAWRVVHWSAYAAWALGLVHGLGIGTDTGEPWARWVYAGSVLVVVAAVLTRLRRAPVPSDERVGAVR
jgi:methionine sulfoxide reductase heme-binding subunit